MRMTSESRARMTRDLTENSTGKGEIQNGKQICPLDHGCKVPLHSPLPLSLFSYSFPFRFVPFVAPFRHPVSYSVPPFPCSGLICHSRHHRSLLSHTRLLCVLSSSLAHLSFLVSLRVPRTSAAVASFRLCSQVAHETK